MFSSRIESVLMTPLIAFCHNKYADSVVLRCIVFESGGRTRPWFRFSANIVTANNPLYGASIDMSMQKKICACACWRISALTVPHQLSGSAALQPLYSTMMKPLFEFHMRHLAKPLLPNPHQSVPCRLQRADARPMIRILTSHNRNADRHILTHLQPRISDILEAYCLCNSVTRTHFTRFKYIKPYMHRCNRCAHETESLVARSALKRSMRSASRHSRTHSQHCIRSNR